MGLTIEQLSQQIATGETEPPKWQKRQFIFFCQKCKTNKAKGKALKFTSRFIYCEECGKEFMKNFTPPKYFEINGIKYRIVFENDECFLGVDKNNKHQYARKETVKV